MLDVGWPFYGLDQADLSADADFDSYFNELLSVAGMDLLHLPVWEQGRYADVQDGGDNAVLRVVQDEDGLLLYPSVSAAEQENLSSSWQSLGALFQDDLPVIQPAVDTAGEALWLGVLRAAGAAVADSGFSAARTDPGQLLLESLDSAFAAQGEVARAAPAPAPALAGLAFSDENAILLPEGQENLASVTHQLFDQIDAAGSGALWKKAANAALSSAPLVQPAASPAALQPEENTRMFAVSGVDGYISPEMLWEQEDRLLERLERRLGQEIANGTEGAFG